MCFRLAIYVLMMPVYLQVDSTKVGNKFNLVKKKSLYNVILLQS